MPDTGVHSGSPAVSDQMPSMSFLGHLEELRMRIVKVLAAVAVGFGICWGFHNQLFAYMMLPIVKALKSNGLDTQLVYLNPTEPFNLYLKISLIAGLFLASPFVLYQVWSFIAPGLYRDEKRYVVPFLFSTVLLFLAGGAFGYAVAYPKALTFLVQYGNQFKSMITITAYTDLFLTVILGLGVIFELPTVVFFLALMGIIDAKWMWKNLRYSILGIFIVAAILTPTTDIMNLCLFAAPMVVLYLISILVAWLVHPKRRKARKEKLQA